MKKETVAESIGVVLGLIIIFICLFLSGIIGAFAWPFVINTWLLYFGKSAVVVWWQGFLLGLVPGIGYLSLPGAAVTWIIMLFL